MRDRIIALVVVVLLVMLANIPQWWPPVQNVFGQVAVNLMSKDERLVHDAEDALQKRDYKESLRLSDAALALNATNLEARRIRARSVYELGYKPGPIEDFEFYIQRKAASGAYPYAEGISLAICYQEQKRYDRALQICNDILKSGVCKKPEDQKRVYCEMANVTYQKGDMKGASELYQKAMVLEPFAVEPYINCSRALTAVQDYYKAYDVLAEAKQRDTTHSADLWNECSRVSRILYDRGYHSLRRKGMSFEACADGAYAFLLRNDPSNAWDAANKCIELRPNDPSGYRMVGDTLFKFEKYEAAAKQYAKAAELAPGNPRYKELQALAERRVAAPLPRK